MAQYSIGEVTLSNGKRMPVLGVGTAAYPYPPPVVVITAVLEAINLGYRMFDTASIYQTEPFLGEAISQALSLGLIKSRDELFITSKLHCADNHGDHVIPALQNTLHTNNDQPTYPPKPEDLVPMDIKSVWTAMEECQKLGLTKSIGVSNFSCKKLNDILAFAKIPPAVNQVEMNPTWQQRKLREFCKSHGITVVGYSPLGEAGTIWGTRGAVESDILKEITKSKGESVAQVALSWPYEQGVVIVTKSFNKERLKQNLEIFYWELSDEESKKIAKIPQSRTCLGKVYVSKNAPIKSVEELWDGEL